MVQEGPKLCCPSVPLSKEEAVKILKSLGKTGENLKEFFRETNSGLWTKNKEPIYDDNKVYNYCIFLNEEGRCSIYPNRPKICRDHFCDNCRE